MNLYENLIDQYGYNVPIVSKDIVYGEYSRPWIMKELKGLCDRNELVRFEKGIYYIPKVTELGLSKINPMKVVERKYVRNGDEVFGFYGGLSLLNSLGVSTQVPSVVEIFTNNETSNARNILVGNQKVILRKARAEITSNNVAVLMLLEIMAAESEQFFRNTEVKDKIKKFVVENNITMGDVDKYLDYYPERTLKTLFRSGVINEFTFTA